MPCVQSDVSVSIIGKHQKIITHSKHNALLATLRQWLSSWILIYAVCVVYLRAHVIKMVPNIANFGQHNQCIGQVHLNSCVHNSFCPIWLHKVFLKWLKPIEAIFVSHLPISISDYSSYSLKWIMFSRIRGISDPIPVTNNGKLCINQLFIVFSCHKHQQELL